MNRGDRAAIHACMARFAEGDRSAFDPLFAALWPVVRSFVARSLPEADADDAAQEAIVKVFARIADFDARRDATTWALTIASFEVLTIRRRRARQRVDGAARPEALVSPRPTPEAEAGARELLDHIDAYVGGISELDRAAIEAELSGEPASGEAARKRRWRAFDRLRQYWRTRHG